MPEKQRIPLLSSKEWAALPTPPKDWIVNGLLRVGRRRPSILAGNAGDGKSTLAKQLAIDIAHEAAQLDHSMGGFLNRKRAAQGAAAGSTF